MRKKLLISSIVISIAVALWLLTPAPINMVVTISPDLRDGPDAWIEWQEELVDAADGIVPGAEKRIVWREPGVRTEYAVVYLHGFSATRQEIAPIPERVAERLGANLFEARLDGHGLQTERLRGVSAESWILDANVALTIGAALGDKVVVISTSTGSTLTTALIEHPNMAAVDTLVMISPNFEPSNPQAKYLTWPGGVLLAKLLTGGERSWTPHNELQEIYWTTTVPIDASVEVMRLVNYAREKLPATIDQNLLMIVSTLDDVVKPEAAHAAFDAIDAPRMRLVEIDELSPTSNHVIAGDILWPANNERFVKEIVEFVSGPDAALPTSPAAPATAHE